MRSAFAKDVLRSIGGSLGRFLAIAGIVALGAGFYAGLRMTAPDMKAAADSFYDGTSLMDVRALSTLGFSDEQIEMLEGVDGVDAVMPAKEVDVMGEVSGGQFVIRLHSLPDSACDSSCSDGRNVSSNDESYLNRLVLETGEWPDEPGECVVSADSVTNVPFSVGDTIEVTDCSQDLGSSLATTELTVVGTVHASYYTTLTNLGSTSLGSGQVDQVAYTLDDTFSPDMPWTEAFLTVDGAREEAAWSDAYNDVVGKVTARLEELAPTIAASRGDELRAEAQAQVDSAREELADAQAQANDELAGAREELDSAAAQISSGESELDGARSAYEQGVNDLNAQLKSGRAQLAQQEAQLADAQAKLDAARPEVDAGRSQLEAAWGQAGMTYDEAVTVLPGIGEQLNAARLQLSNLQATSPESTDEIAKLSAQVSTLEQQQSTLASLVAQQARINDFDAQAAQLADGWEKLGAARAEASAAEASARAQLDEAAAQISSGEAELASARAGYDDGEREYDEAAAQAADQIASAQSAIDDAQKQVDAVADPTVYVLDRTKNVGAASFESDSGRIDSIASVFPFIFFLVAALVALTTMTRMVDEERVLIGTYKALGYSRARITSKYVGYAAIASIAGGVVGIAALSQVLPWVIQTAYGIIYIVPVMPMGTLPIDVPIAAASLLLGVGVTLVATAAAAVATLRERPATLMLPRAPKAGKRILLERITPLWSRLSFSWKVCMRNLFRYKKRFIMTIIGIAGCTALLLTGLGLSNAINDIIDNQFGKITVFNLTVRVDDDADATAWEKVGDVLSGNDAVSEYTRVHSETLVARAAGEGDGAEDFSATLVVPTDPDGFTDYVYMKPRLSDAEIAMKPDSVVITEKLSTLLGAGPGDSITLAETDDAGNATGSSYEVVVTDVMENYVENYVYVGPDAYRDAWDAQAPAETALAITSEDEAARTELSDELLSLPEVVTVAYNDETIDTYHSMIDSVNIVVVVLVVAAAALAFIVLYNLTNINIAERAREIATLKVLGFFPREVDAYIYREVVILSVIGAAIGMVLGVFLEGFVVTTAEVDQVMFGRAIHPMSFIAAFGLTLAFTFAVLIAMRGKLARIDMVASLKSVE